MSCETLDEQVVFIYCLCADILKAMQHGEDPQAKMSDAEVITTGLVAALFFAGNVEKARQLLREPRYIPTMLSKSRLNRRLHRVRPLLMYVFHILAQVFKELHADPIYALDSFPFAVCDNYRIQRCRIYQGKQFRGYIASKRRYFYGLRVHLMVTQAGEPVEFFFVPGACADAPWLEEFAFDLPAGAVVYGDKAFNVYWAEDILLEATGIQLLPIRKKNSTRPLPPHQQYLQHRYRKIVETTASLLERLLPKSIHAVTNQGFELKLIFFMLACSFTFLV